MLILAVGDVIGKPGRGAVKKLLPGFRQQYGLDLVIANGENAAGGLGLTSATAKELFNAGVDVLTSGNHIWAQKEIIPYLDGEMPILRPLNYPPVVPGKGYIINSQIMVVNLMGRTFIGNFDCPFRAMDKLLAGLETKPAVIIVDFHAEATSEKQCFGHFVDGRASFVVGTHTHIPTADHQILPGGTAYMTDAGMCGDYDSSLGMEKDEPLHRFLNKVSKGRMEPASGPATMCGVAVDISDTTGLAIDIAPVRLGGRLAETIPDFWTKA